MEGYKHYIRTHTLLESGIIIHGFSDAFEQPQEGDIQLQGNFGRHFQLLLFNERGQFALQYIDNEIFPRSQEDLDAEWNARPPALPTETDILGQQLVEKDIQILQLQADNDTLGQRLVDLDIRLMIGGL